MDGSGSFINKNGCIIRQSNTSSFSEYSELLSFLREHNIKNLYHIVEYGSKNNGSMHCLGTRRLIERQVIHESGRSLEKFVLGNYEWMSYAEADEQSIGVGNGLMKIGHKPGENIVIFAETRQEWLISAMGCFYCGLTIVTLYNTLSDEALVSALNETEPKTMFTSPHLLRRVLKLKEDCKFLNTLIVMENQLENINEFLQECDKFIIITFKKFLKLGKTFTGKVPSNKNSLEDTAVIMYTSGSTGIPKGVLLSHKNILASISTYPSTMHITSNDRYLALLPLAHIMELISELSCLAMNIPILYSSPTTLTSSSTRILKGSLGDAAVGRPTFTMVVPLVLDRMIKSVYKTVNEGGFIKSLIFHAAVKIKTWLSSGTFISTLLDILLFNRIKSILGGELAIIGVGGSPLNENTHKTIATIFGCSIRTGYGTTETTACVSGMDWRDASTGHVGPPNFGVYIRLVNDFQKNYTDLVTEPRGEIHAGGDVISKGYFKRPEETEEAFYENNAIRWFMTGDIGEMTNRGCLKIVDRKKDFIKLKHGEYISLQNIECIYKTHMLVENICIIANPYKESVAAILAMCTGNIKMFSSISKLVVNIENNISNLYSKEEFLNAVKLELSRYGKEKKLNKWEIPNAIFISSEVWTPESGHLTASMKIRRKHIEAVYESQIKKMMDNME